MTALSEPERLVREGLAAAPRLPDGSLNRDQIERFQKALTTKARDLVAALRPLLAADPEIVDGGVVEEFPKGSRFVPLTPDGKPILGASVIGVGAPTLDGVSYLVLHRAPAPAPKVGGVVRTEAELDRLPERSVVRDDRSLLCERMTSSPKDWVKYGPGATSRFLPPALPATVLDLGGDS